MRQAVIPAQITTIEDKVAGNLSMTQLGLLAAPLFIGGLIYLLVPPLGGSAGYKLGLIALVAAIAGTLAVRFQGRLVLDWVVTIGQYNRRPRYYVHDKNDPYLRAVDEGGVVRAVGAAGEGHERPGRGPLTRAEAGFLERIAASPRAGVEFKAGRKGDMRVRIREVK